MSRDDACIALLVAALSQPRPAVALPAPVAPVAPVRPQSRRLVQRIRDQSSTSALARWYAAMCDGPRAKYRGFAVVLQSRQVHGDTSTWAKACRLADQVGGQVVLWTSGLPPGAPDDGGNVGSEFDQPKART